jgi:hypothetical protein
MADSQISPKRLGRGAGSTSVLFRSRVVKSDNMARDVRREFLRHDFRSALRLLHAAGMNFHREEME